MNITFKILLSIYALNTMAASFLPWNIENVKVRLDGLVENVRMGYVDASVDVEFKGDVLYYQGLSDSMLNHDPLFEALVNEGYKVIAFDYFGQGASSGTLNDVSTDRIIKLGNLVYSKYRTKSAEKYNIVGWGIGGLAAYQKAYVDQGRTVKKVALMSPGLYPKMIVGEGVFNYPMLEISQRTLSSNEYSDSLDPHEDPISPKSAIGYPKFVINLQMIAIASRKWVMPKTVEGIALLSGPMDNYVDSVKTRSTLEENAKHFGTMMYTSALHEIDNEKEATAYSVQRNIAKFFNRK